MNKVYLKLILAAIFLGLFALSLFLGVFETTAPCQMAWGWGKEKERGKVMRSGPVLPFLRRTQGDSSAYRL